MIGFKAKRLQNYERIRANIRKWLKRQEIDKIIRQREQRQVDTAKPKC